MIRFRLPIGLGAIAVFFAFGAIASLIAAITLWNPHTPLEPLWRINPAGHAGLQRLVPWSILLMGAVSLACATTAAGLWTAQPWARVLAIAILSLNLVGDVFSAVFRRHPITLLGIPIGGALILYLRRTRVAQTFHREHRPPEATS